MQITYFVQALFVAVALAAPAPQAQGGGKSPYYTGQLEPKPSRPAPVAVMNLLQLAPPPEAMRATMSPANKR
jgi:hypothetical protein